MVGLNDSRILLMGGTDYYGNSSGVYVLDTASMLAVRRNPTKEDGDEILDGPCPAFDAHQNRRTVGWPDQVLAVTSIGLLSYDLAIESVCIVARL